MGASKLYIRERPIFRDWCHAYSKYPDASANIRLLKDTHHADLKLMPYHLTTPGNRIFINGILKNGGDDSTAKALGFDFSTPYDAKTADALPLSAIQVFIDLLERL